MDMRKYARRSAYIKIDDVRDEPIDGTIAHVKEGKFGKPDMTLESGKVLSLNGSNTETLINAFGDDSDRWIGKQIKLSLGRIHYQGEDNEAVIVEPISSPIPKKPAKSEAPKSAQPDPSDEIPF